MNDMPCGSNESRRSKLLKSENRRNTLKYVRRVLLYSVIMVVCVALLTAQAGKITTKDQKSAESIAAAITALGGEKNIDNIKSLILRGTMTYSTRSHVDETEIRILFPDNYLRIDKRIGSGSMTRYAGVSSGESRYRVLDGTGGKMYSAAYNEVNRFAVLLMGALLKGVPVAPLTISAVAGTSDRFSIAKETGVFGEIEVDPVSKYPLLISFKDDKRPTMTDGTLSFSMGIGEVKTIDSVMRFADRVAVDGVMFPGTIFWEPGDSDGTIRELKIEKVLINPPLSLADFEIPEYR